MAVVHTAAPVALFRACAEVGIRRVIQVSALGIEVGNTPYARSKRQADVALLACAQAGGLDAVVLRPSIVIGPGGASTALFQTLARWPVLVWPQRARVCRVQALTVADLAWGCARLLGPQAKVTGVVAAVGPEPYSLEAWVARFRMAHGHHAPARVWGMPDGLAGALAGVGDLLPFTPWGSNTWALLAQDNVADVGPWAAVLGRAPMPVLPANMTAPRTHT
jgi:nucleoside-diphosphate-sugar epimerase